ncbi:shikimate kinase [Acuticoccus sp. MNP-M23]|uniref:shikimate kinase n=1 Tax=Acuticoccus sp. MNP-M23 TaxID=3072793 RepID=UPI0028166817|nr:shikimate kinase [Acuticoccus sp. MNP-M23]WMS41604.1 shikimate kinase [Acuticoccus sp. MNP-M23]
MDTQGLAHSAGTRRRRGTDRWVRQNIVLVGLPGVGKSSVGRRLAYRLGLPFVDADNAIEDAAGMSIPDIFTTHGEAAFREGETRVITRLLRDGPQVVATGGGAFMSAETRAAVAELGISVWLDASNEVLVSRIAKRNHRPLFRGVDPNEKLKELRAVRDPLFAEANIRVASSFGPHERVVNRIVRALRARQQNGAPNGNAPC